MIRQGADYQKRTYANWPKLNMPHIFIKIIVIVTTTTELSLGQPTTTATPNNNPCWLNQEIEFPGPTWPLIPFMMSRSQWSCLGFNFLRHKIEKLYEINLKITFSFEFSNFKQPMAKSMFREMVNTGNKEKRYPCNLLSF